MVQIKFETMQGFEEFPTPYVLVRDHYKGGVERWFSYFGPGVCIEKLSRPFYKKGGYQRFEYLFQARTDYYIDMFIKAFGNDTLYCYDLNHVRNKLLKLLATMDYQKPFMEKYEIVR